MTLGARHALWRKGLTAKSYIRNGLVAMWDGIENAGWGKHDSNATTWVDLSGHGRDATLSGTYSWEKNCWNVMSVSGRGLARWDGRNLGSSQTLEFVIHPTSGPDYGRIMAESWGIPSPCVSRSHGGNDQDLYMYGYGNDQSMKNGYHVFRLLSHSIKHTDGVGTEWWVNGVKEVSKSNAWRGSSPGDTYAYFANRPSDYRRGIDARYYCVRIYNRELTEEEQAHNYEIDCKRFPALTN